MNILNLVAEVQRLVGFHIEMRKLRNMPIGFGDVLQAFDEDRDWRPQDRFHQECRAIAELHVRDVLGVRRYDA